jgi:hypothetical protein
MELHIVSWWSNATQQFIIGGVFSAPVDAERHAKLINKHKFDTKIETVELNRGYLPN